MIDRPTLLGRAVSRRAFVRLAGSVAALPILACQPAPTPSPATAPTVAAPRPTDTPRIEPTTPPSTAVPISTAAATPVAAASTPSPVVPTAVPSPTAAPATPSPAAGRVTIAFLHPWQGDHGGARAMTALAKRYGELRPNVAIQPTIVTGNEYERKQVAAFASGNVPDLTLVTADTLPVYADRGVLLGLDDRVRREGVDLTEWFDFVVAQCSWQGALYAMTHHPDVRTVVYRSAPVMAESGLDPAAEPGSWDELKDWALKMNREDGGQVVRYGWVPFWTQELWAVTFPQANGAPLLDAAGRRVSFDVAPVVEALEYVVRATDEINRSRDAVLAFEGKQPFRGQEDLYAEGVLGLAIGGNWYLDRIANVARDPLSLQSRVSTMPGGPAAPGQRFVFGSGTMDAIPRGGREPDAAWEYARWIAGPEGQHLMQSVSYDVAGHRDAAHDPRIVDQRLLRKEILPMFEHATPAHLNTPAWQAMRDDIVRAQDAMLLKQLTPERAARQLQDRLQSILDQYWARRGQP